MEATRQPFASVPAEAADVLRPVLPGLADEAIATIAAEVPGYARALEGQFGEIVRIGVEVAFNRFVDLITDPRAEDLGSARETYVNLGRGEFHFGRSLEALLAAYRVGARLAWRRFVEAGVAGGLDPGAIYTLGEAIFAYIDELSAASAEGYAEEQSAAAGESQRRRRRLVRLLAQDPPPTREAIRTAAAGVGWPLPRTLAALVAAEVEGSAAPTPVPARDGEEEPPSELAPAPVPEREQEPRAVPAELALAAGAVPGGEEAIVDATASRLARRLGPDAVGAEAGGLALVFVADPDAPGRRRLLEAALEGSRAALGPAVPWHDALASVRRAATAYRLAASGRLVADGLVVAEDHLATLVLAADPGLASDLKTSRLAPLADLPPGVRERMLETLRAWLDRPGQVQAVAAELGVHPQTVRYRVRQLRDRFGPRLDDPEARFELSMAVRA